MVYPRETLSGARRIAFVALVFVVAGMGVTGSVAAPADAPSDQHVHDTNAFGGDTNPTWITDANPHFSWINNLGETVDRQRVQVAESVDDVPSDVLAHWRMNSNTDDASGNNRVLDALTTIPVARRPEWQDSGRSDFSGMLHFDDIDVAYASGHTGLDVLPVTVEAWVKPISYVVSSGRNYIITKGDDVPYHFRLGYYSADGSADCRTHTTGNSARRVDSVGITTLTTGNWHHVACTLSSPSGNTVLQLYVNGVLVDSDNWAGETPNGTTTQPVMFGIDEIATDGDLHADVDEVRIHNRVLSAAEIAATYASGAAYKYPQIPGAVIWDSSDATGEPLNALCPDGDRCEDIEYDIDGNAGTGDPLTLGGTQYFVRAQFMGQVSDLWSNWSDWDWFETAANNGPPAGMYTGNASAAQGFQNATEISSATPHFSWLNQTGEDVDAHHTQVYSSGLDGVMALYHLDGDAVDASGNLGNGAVSGSVAWPAGQYDTAIGMTGASQYVTIPNFESSSFTIEFWTYLDTCSGDGSTYIVASKSPNSSSTDGPWVIEFDCDGTMDPLDCQGETTTDEYEVASNFGTVTGQWVHYACVVDGDANEVRLYRNGELDNAESFPGTVVHNSNDVSYLGRRRYTGGSGAGYYKGRIDEVRLSNVARSAEQIRSAYHAGYPHHTLMWDSGQGVAFDGSCAHHTRCEDIVYGVDGNPGTALPLLPDDVRYEARSRYRTAPGGTWSDWSNWDWFETSQPVAQPTAQHTHNDDALAGDIRPSNITSTTPHFSWFNNAGEAVDRQQVQVVNDTLDDVVGLWRFDGDASDAGPNGLDGTLDAGAPGFLPSSQTGFGESLVVDGDDSVEVAYDPLLDLANDFTVDTWFKTSDLSLSSYNSMIFRGNACGGGSPDCNFNIYFVQANGRLIAKSISGTTPHEVMADSTTLSDGTWHHVAMTVDSGNMLRMYVDGVLQADSEQMTGPAVTTAHPMDIGSINGNASFFNGQLDEVRVLDRALTGPEILGYVLSTRPHYTLMWESADDTGEPLDGSCADLDRCEDIVFDEDGNPGSALGLNFNGARYHTRARFMTEAGDLWSAWSDWDWFEMASVPAAPSDQFAHDTDASTGDINPTAITHDDPHFSWINNAGGDVDRQRVQVVNTPLDGVVGLWSFDSDTIDKVGDVGDASLGNGLGYAAGSFGDALDFDGSDDYATLPKFDLTTYTVDFWSRLDACDGSQYETQIIKATAFDQDWTYKLSWDCLGATHDGLLFEAHASGANDIQITWSTEPPVGEWVHIAAVVDDATKTAYLYANGELRGSDTFSGTIVNDPADYTQLGNENLGGAGANLHGSIDELRISDEARDADEIAGYYATQAPHNTLMWDSDTLGSGVALGSDCSDGNRCDDIVYGATGTATGLVYGDARYYVRSQFRTPASGSDLWSAWSGWDWFETQATTGVDISQCQTGTPDVTEFTPTIPGTPVTTSDDCTISFGAAGDSTELRIYQADRYGDAAIAYPDGTSLESDFSGDGYDHSAFGTALRSRGALGMDSQGRYVVGGGWWNAGNEYDMRLWRALPGGGIDNSFSGDGVQEAPSQSANEDYITDLVVLPDDSVVAVGPYSENGTTDYGIVKVDEDGVLDPTFGGGDGFASGDLAGQTRTTLTGVARQSDGQLIAVGVSNDGSDRGILARFRANGTLDTSFGTSGYRIFDPEGGTSEMPLIDVAISSDDSIIAAGMRRAGAAHQQVVAKFTPDGALDTTGFGGGDGWAVSNAPQLEDQAYYVVEHADGSIYVGGPASGSTVVASKFDASGVLDASFAGGSVTSPCDCSIWVHEAAIAVLPDGSLLQTTRMPGSGDDMVVYKYLPNGSLDPDFGNDGPGVYRHNLNGNHRPYGMTHGRDGDIVVVGQRDDSNIALWMLEDAGTVPNFAAGATDWDDGAGAFGACLRDARNGAKVDPDTWDEAPGNDCSLVDDSRWNGVPAVPNPAAVVAETTGPGVVGATVDVRFGVRVPTGIDAGTTLMAPLIVEAVSPDI